MATAAILKFILTAITWTLLTFAQNLAQRLKATSQKRIYLQVSLLRTFKMVPGAMLAYGVMAITRQLWIIFA